MTRPGENLARIIGAWAEILRTGSAAALAALLDEEVVWQGVLPELACQGRAEATRFLGRAPLAKITRMEAEERGDRVVVSVESADFPVGPVGPAGEVLQPAGGARTLVFTFSGNGRVVRMESFLDKGAAFTTLAS
jgi:hypothetical protein